VIGSVPETLKYVLNCHSISEAAIGYRWMEWIYVIFFLKLSELATVNVY
jgi:hypothetical protein